MIGCETYCSLCFYEVFAFLPSTCTSRPFSPPPPFFFFFRFRSLYHARPSRACMWRAAPHSALAMAPPP